ncbi:serine hydrolase [Nonomuraea sp. NPDC050790]|uniref:serine hydrolase n=1 Tax=Nonomuraea sp. NPDC050790 TaxID=3364371 RepID=UPI00379B5C65
MFTSKSLLSVAAAATLVVGCADTQATAGATTTPSPSPTTSAAPEIPATPAGAQLRWVIDGVGRAPLAESEFQEHVAADFLSQVPVNTFNEIFVSLKGMKLNSVNNAQPTLLYAVITAGGQKFATTLGVDATGKINTLRFEPVTPPPPAPKSWKELESRLAKVAPRTGYLAARIDGRRCHTIRAGQKDTVRPLGSMFKLYVLGTVAKQVREGRLSWDTQLTITPELKSLPGGELQNRPDGSKVSVLEAAKLMISISDNTGTDLLMHKVGRESVEKTLRAWGGHLKGNIPLLTTRELFQLKGADYPRQARAYLAMSIPEKRAYLRTTVAKAPLSAIKPWPAPRELDTIEWFGSPADICRAHAELRRLRDPKVGEVMSVNPGGLGQGTWFKGGSEAGVADLGYSYRRGGKTYFVTFMTSNLTAPLPSTAESELVSLAQGASKLTR